MSAQVKKFHAALAFKELHQNIIAELAPVGALEEHIVWTIARLVWRKEHLATLRKGELVLEHESRIQAQKSQFEVPEMEKYSAERRDATMQAAEVLAPSVKVYGEGDSMGRIILTDKFCQTVKAAGEHYDAQVPGLMFRVLPSRPKAWRLRYISPRDGGRRRLGLGNYPATTLAAARGRALEAKELLDGGQDPRLVLADVAADAMTVAMLIDSYIAKHALPNLRSHAELERRA